MNNPSRDPSCTPEPLAADFTGWETDNAEFERTDGGKEPAPEARL